MKPKLTWGNLEYEGLWVNWKLRDWFFGPDSMDCGCFSFGLGPFHFQWGHPDGCYWFIDFEEKEEDANSPD